MAKEVIFELNELKRRLESIKAKDIMTRDIMTTTETATLSEVAEIMIKERIRGLPVEGKKGKVVGIITEGDLFLVVDMIKSGDIVENGMKPGSIPTVKFAMSTEIIKINQNTTLDEILSVMKYRNAHTLPVFEGNKMVGIIGRRDVFDNFYAAVKDLYL